MKGAFELAKITLKQCVREKSFYGAIVITLVAIFGLFMVFVFTMFEVPRILMNYVLSYTNLITLVLVFLTLFNLLQYDIDRKTLQYIVSLPLRRNDYIIGRYIGIMLFAILIAGGILVLFYPFLLLLIKQRPDAPFSTWRYFVYFFYITTEISILSAIALLISTLSTKSIITFLTTLGSYLIGHSLDEVKEFLLTQKGAETPMFSKILVKIATLIFPNLSLFDVKIALTYNLTLTPSQIILTILYGFLYTGLLLLLATAIFSRREIL